MKITLTLFSFVFMTSFNAQVVSAKTYTLLPKCISNSLNIFQSEEVSWRKSSAKCQKIVSKMTDGFTDQDNVNGIYSTTTQDGKISISLQCERITDDKKWKELGCSGLEGYYLKPKLTLPDSGKNELKLSLTKYLAPPLNLDAGVWDILKEELKFEPLPEHLCQDRERPIRSFSTGEVILDTECDTDGYGSWINDSVSAATLIVIFRIQK